MKDWIPFEHGYYKQNGKTVTWRLKQFMPKDNQMTGRKLPRKYVSELGYRVDCQMWDKMQKHIPIKYIVNQISDISAEDYCRLGWYQMPWNDKTKHTGYYTFLNTQKQGDK